MKKRIMSTLAVALTAGVAMGAAIGWNGAGDGTSWTDANNWVGGVLPGAADYAVQNSAVSDATIVLSSAVSVGGVGLCNNGTGNVNMHLILTNGASLVSTGFVDVARNKTPGALTMYGSSIQTTGTGAGLMVGRPQGGVAMNGTVVMYNSTIDLFGNLTMFDNQAAQAGVTASVTLNNGSWISSLGISAVDSGTININSGSYLKVRNLTSDGQIDILIGQSVFVVDGTTVTALNKATYVYKDATNTYVIPEPATALLFGIGGIGAWMLRRSKIKSQEEDGSDA